VKKKEINKGKRGEGWRRGREGCIVAVGGWTPLDGFIYILALTPSRKLFTLLQSCDFV